MFNIGANENPSLEHVTMGSVSLQRFPVLGQASREANIQIFLNVIFFFFSETEGESQMAEPPNREIREC